MQFSDEGKWLYYWLTDTDAKTKIHAELYDGQTPSKAAFMKVSGIIVQPATEQAGGLLSASKFEVIH